MALSYDEAVAQISGPGSPFETMEESVNGVSFRVFKNAPPNLRGIFDGARLDDNIFLVYEDEEWSYKKVMEHADALGYALVHEYGIKKGDRVGIKTLEDGRKVRVFKSNGEEIKAA